MIRLNLHSVDAINLRSLLGQDKANSTTREDITPIKAGTGNRSLILIDTFRPLFHTHLPSRMRKRISMISVRFLDVIRREIKTQQYY